MPGGFFLSSGYWVTMSFLSHCPYLDLTFPQFMCALFSASYLVLLPSLSVEVVLTTSFLSHLTVLHASYLPSTFACPHVLNHSCFSNHVLLLNATSSAKNWFILFVFSNPICLKLLRFQFILVHFSCSVVSDCLRPHESQHARPPCPSPAPGVYSNSCLSSWWWHPAISSSVVLFSSCHQSLPASGSFPMSQPFTWSGQSIGVSASASVPDELWREVRDIVQETGNQTIPLEKKCKKAKWLSEEGLTKSCEKKRSEKLRRKGKI